jgi:hypothetical protein
MGYSYGYNKEEDIWDYNSAQSLVLALVDKVSRGGNFLLDIGPDDHGKIPPIMQERLLQIGAWLQENGEAIYNTRRWIRTSQAAANNSKEKDLYFTYNPTSNALYAIAPTFNNSGEYIIKDLDVPAGTNISFVATKEKCAWKKVGNDIVVTMPAYKPAMIKAPYAYVIKIENFGAFAAKPKIEITYPNGAQTPTVALIAPTGAAVHYTTDGTNPTLSSPTYTNAFTLAKTTIVKAQIFDNNKLPGKVSEATAKANAEANTKAEATAKAGKVEVTDMPALVLTLQKALHQCTLLNQTLLKGALLDAIVEFIPDFTESAK